LVNRSFRQFKLGIIQALILSFSYIVWTEVVTGPLNNFPVGSMSAGLPYPFLNDMVLTERFEFYGISILTGVFFYFLFWVFDKVGISYYFSLST